MSCAGGDVGEDTAEQVMSLYTPSRPRRNTDFAKRTTLPHRSSGESYTPLTRMFASAVRRASYSEQSASRHVAFSRSECLRRGPDDPECQSWAGRSTYSRCRRALMAPTIIGRRSRQSVGGDNRSGCARREQMDTRDERSAGRIQNARGQQPRSSTARNMLRWITELWRRM